MGGQRGGSARPTHVGLTPRRSPSHARGGDWRRVSHRFDRRKYQNVAGKTAIFVSRAANLWGRRPRPDASSERSPARRKTTKQPRKLAILRGAAVANLAAHGQSCSVASHRFAGSAAVRMRKSSREMSLAPKTGERTCCIGHPSHRFHRRRAPLRRLRVAAYRPITILTVDSRSAEIAKYKIQA